MERFVQAKKQVAREPLEDVRPRSQRPSASSAAPYILLWIAASSAVILHNDYLLRHGFPHPLTLTTIHLSFATVATQVLRHSTTLIGGGGMTAGLYLRRMVPIAATFSVSLALYNTAYLHLSVAFIQMVKASTPVAVLLVSFIAAALTPQPHGQAGSPLERAWQTCQMSRRLPRVCVVVVGVATASYGELALDGFGLAVQVGGILFESTRLVLLEHTVKGMDALTALYYFAPACAALNAFLAAAKEWPIGLPTPSQAGVLVANAGLAFALNLAVLMLVRRTSGLVLTLSGVLKDIWLVTLGCTVLGHTVTPLQIAGYAVALAGLVWYRS
ncbi:hypothetical protein PYCC9005_002066 [Savitreella phatthalungensis]